MQKDLLDQWGGGTHLKNSFLFPISLVGEMVFSTQIYNLGYTKNRFVSANMLKSKRVGRKEKLFILRLIFLRKTIG